jgi:predicted alpha/beta hydrolase family esterase
LRPAEYPALISPGARCLCGRLWLGGVYKTLTRDGHSVSIVQNPTISLEGDVAVTKRTLAAQYRPTILVGHPHGGAVITEAGNHPKVAGLAYIAAFAPDKASPWQRSTNMREGPNVATASAVTQEA